MVRGVWNGTCASAACSLLRTMSGQLNRVGSLRVRSFDGESAGISRFPEDGSPRTPRWCTSHVLFGSKTQRNDRGPSGAFHVCAVASQIALDSQDGSTSKHPSAVVVPTVFVFPLDRRFGFALGTGRIPMLFLIRGAGLSAH